MALLSVSYLVVPLENLLNFTQRASLQHFGLASRIACRVVHKVS